MVQEAIQNFDNRGKIYLPAEPVKAIGEFSVESIGQPGF
jgi:hypothetical protein